MRAIGPAVSSECERGVTPKRLTSPKVGLMPDMPQSADGMRMEPPVSEPRPKGKKPDATPAPVPLDEPPGMRPSPHGLRGMP